MRTSYADLHEMIDRLTPEQAEAEAIRVVVHQFPSASDTPRDDPDLSFIGLIPDGPSDLAERSEEIIRSRFRAA